MVAAHAAAAVAPTPKEATPALMASAPLIGATAFAPALLGPAPVLRALAPVARVVVVVVPWEAEMGLAGPRALERSIASTSSSLVVDLFVSALEVCASKARLDLAKGLRYFGHGR